MATQLFSSLDENLSLVRFYGGAKNGTCYQVTWGEKYWEFHKLEDAQAVYDALSIAHHTIKLTAFKKG